MPLTSTEFAFLVDEETLRDVKAVHEFLKVHSNLAYTVDEVAAAVGQEARLVSQILEKLDDLELVEGGTVNGALHFIYRADLPLSVR